MSGSDRKTYVTMKEFMDLAIKFEIESADFYVEIKSLVSDDETINLMNKLAAQETDHARILGAYTAPSGDVATFQFGPELSLSMPPAPAQPTLENMLDVAIERERKSAQIYHAAAGRTSGEFREMIESLAGFEEEHEDRLTRLKAAYRKGEQPGGSGPARVSQPIYTKLATQDSKAAPSDESSEDS